MHDVLYGNAMHGFAFFVCFPIKKTDTSFQIFISLLSVSFPYFFFLYHFSTRNILLQFFDHKILQKIIYLKNVWRLVIKRNAPWKQ